MCHDRPCLARTTTMSDTPMFESTFASAGAEASPESRLKSVAEMLDDAARRWPARTALRCGTDELDYADLAGRADLLAHRLEGLGVGADSVIGICLPRRPCLLVAILAVLKAGAAYLPLDPRHPEPRRRFMIAD